MSVLRIVSLLVICQAHLIYAYPSIEKAPQVEHLDAPLKLYFKTPEFQINFRVQGTKKSTDSDLLRTVNELMRRNSDWLSGTVVDCQPIVTKTYMAYYNLFLAEDYESMLEILRNLNVPLCDSSGRSLVVVDSTVNKRFLGRIVNVLWSHRMMNIALIVRKDDEGSYLAFNYEPFREGSCDSKEPSLLDEFNDGRWSRLHQWFPDRVKNFNGCTLQAGTIPVKPYSMVRVVNNRITRFGMEVTVVKNIAERLNFSIQYRTPEGKVKWGLIQAQNSTGLVGMIQRHEVEFGFGLGINVFRNTYLKMGTPSIISQLNLAIPADKPYTSLEKLYKPFSPAAWVCVVLCYALFTVVTFVIFDLKLIERRIERFPNPVYSLWVLLMGGPAGSFRHSSLRLFIAGFMLNALVVRTMYQAAMFQRLQATTKLGSKLNTFQQINDAKMFYYMYNTTATYYQDIPLLRGRIRVLFDESKDFDKIMYDVSQHKLNGVFAIPLDCIEYYVKNYGQRGIVYAGKHTGINYNIGLYYPKTSPFTKPFNAVIARFQAAGLTHVWREEFRDTRYWNGAKNHPEPTSLRWHHVSGAFYLWAFFLGLSLIALFGEITMSR